MCQAVHFWPCLPSAKILYLSLSPELSAKAGILSKVCLLHRPVPFTHAVPRVLPDTCSSQEPRNHGPETGKQIKYSVGQRERRLKLDRHQILGLGGWRRCLLGHRGAWAFKTSSIYCLTVFRRFSLTLIVEDKFLPCIFHLLRPLPVSVSQTLPRLTPSHRLWTSFVFMSPLRPLPEPVFGLFLLPHSACKILGPLFHLSSHK